MYKYIKNKPYSNNNTLKLKEHSGQEQQQMIAFINTQQTAGASLLFTQNKIDLQ